MLGAVAPEHFGSPCVTMLHLLERTLSNSDFDLHIIEAYRNMCEVNDIVVRGGITLTDAESTN